MSMGTTEETIVETPKNLRGKLNREKLSEIGSYILEGLSEEEACIMAGFSPKDFKEIKKSNEDVVLYLQKKLIEFKRKHLRNINAKSSDKNSMWILEAVLPDQFGAKKKGGDTTVNVIGAIISEVRKNNELTVKAEDEKKKIGGGAGKVFDVDAALK